MRRVCVALAMALVATVSVAPGASANIGAKKRGPATAQLTFAGAAGLAGLATEPQVSCNFPNVDGSVSIFVLDQPPDSAVLFNMRFTAGKVSVGVYSGSGTAFRGRSFEGSGVEHFNAAKGAQIDSTLRETTASNPGENPGTLGAITSIKGSIDCGNQRTGTSTVNFSGATADGAVKGRLRPFRVECDTSAPLGNSVHLVGVVKVGSTKALVITNLTPDSISIFESNPGPPAIQHQYLVKAAGVSKLSATGARVKGAAVEQSPTNGAAHTLDVKGNVTCGTTVNR